MSDRITEHAFGVVTGASGMLFDHAQGRALEASEVSLYVDLPEYKDTTTKDGYLLRPLPSASYACHNLSISKMAVLFNEELAAQLQNLKVEVRIIPHDDSADILLDRSLRGLFVEMTRQFTAMRREFKKIRIKQRDERGRKKIHVKAVPRVQPQKTDQGQGAPVVRSP